MEAEGERRRHLRLYEPFPATVRGVDASGEPFEVSTVLDNISASGLYMQLGRCVKRGTKLFILVRMSTTPAGWSAPLRHGGLSSAHRGHLGRTWRWVVQHVVWGRGMVVHPWTSLGGTASGPCVALRGVVVRMELQLNGRCSVAVAFTHSRFL